MALLPEQPPSTGRSLIQLDQVSVQFGPQSVLRTLDLFVETIVPGERRRVRTGSIGANLRNRAGGLCGLVPNETIVVVVDRRPQEKPGFSRIFRPADQYLNGDCTDDQGYYVSQQLLGAP